MAHPKFDGVIEAVRYSSDGKIAFVRAYERRGPTFSDIVLLDRQTLLDRLESGKQFVTGQRKALLASTFDVRKAVKRLEQNDEEIITTNGLTPGRDQLEDVPIL